MATAAASPTIAPASVDSTTRAATTEDNDATTSSPPPTPPPPPPPPPPPAAADASNPPVDSVQEQIRQLNDMRKVVLGNVNYYSSIVQGILPIISPSSLPALRRWGADFLAEAFAAPALPSREKETLSLLVLESLRGMVANADEDPFVLRSIIQAAASIYPLVMRWIVNNSYDTPTWERMTAIKSRILRLWDSPSASVQICCIKFAQRVVLAQTASSGGEHKRDGLDISLSLVPPNHPLLDPRHLEAEASGLLDRMLSVLQDSNDAVVVDATLNTLAVLIRTRPSTTNRTLNALLNFNPFKMASNGSAMTPRTRVMVRSMEKTTRMLLIHLTKREPNMSYQQRIQQHLERLMRSRAEVFDENSRKRALADQQAAAYGNGDAKRQRLASGTAQQQQQQQQQQQTQQPQQLQPIPPLGPGPHSLADIFTLTSSAQLRTFQASNVPLDLATKITSATLARLDQKVLDRAIQAVRDRLTALSAAGGSSAASLALLNPNTAPLGVEEDDDDDYEPDFSTAEDAEQILNKLDNEGGGSGTSKPDVASALANPLANLPGLGGLQSLGMGLGLDAASLALGAFKLPTAPTLTPEQTVKVGEATVARVFDTMRGAEDTTGAPASSSTSSSLAVARKAAAAKTGLNRVAASTGDRESWITILTRIATRPVSGLDEGEAGEDDNQEEEDDEDEDDYDVETGTIIKKEKPPKPPAKRATVLNDTVRETLFRYVLEDFRKRIDVAVGWLCEEWYNDQLERQYSSSRRETETQTGGQTEGQTDTPNYDTWVVRLLDGFLPYLHSQDNKVLTRFLSEVPALSAALLQRVKSLCRDPSMVPVALTSLLYQLMMRPPARALTLDTMQEIWLEFEDARPMATKYLDKWRPGFVQTHSNKVAAA